MNTSTNYREEDMLPFNYDQFRAGAPAVTRDGKHTARFVRDLYEPRFMMVSLDKEERFEVAYTVNGHSWLKLVDADESLRLLRTYRPWCYEEIVLSAFYRNKNDPAKAAYRIHGIRPPKGDKDAPLVVFAVVCWDPAEGLPYKEMQLLVVTPQQLLEGFEYAITPRDKRWGVCGLPQVQNEGR